MQDIIKDKIEKRGKKSMSDGSSRHPWQRNKELAKGRDCKHCIFWAITGPLDSRLFGPVIGLARNCTRIGLKVKIKGVYAISMRW